MSKMAYVETYRTTVRSFDCDALGHMNVSRYFAASANGIFSLQANLGLGLEDITRGRRLSFAVIHSESNFREEVHAGHVIYLMTGILKVCCRSVLFHHLMFKADGNVLAFESRLKCVLLDLVERKARRLPSDIRKRAERYLVGL